MNLIKDQVLVPELLVWHLMQRNYFHNQLVHFDNLIDLVFCCTFRIFNYIGGFRTDNVDLVGY